ncbi:hypothetical protein ATN84_25050 [Paramesorhizobium deserti]|uniref:Uncharacterized protein n=1 Tax=Paramesorhizobium deserti TaxID=1494590 RepID=A0A135HXE7_9HYPH|nr:hypothetical protein [Paramesorhizobium deserti]KXF77886.1 hypothetical protein ATN84_25050 [Paramesorhizobium deserti]
MSIDIGNGEAVSLSPGGGAKGYVQQTSRHFPGEVLIAHNERDRGLFDIYHVNVANGESILVEKNDGFFGFFTDQHFQVRFAKRYTDDGEVEILKRNGNGAWETVSHIPTEDSLTTRPIECNDDGEELYWIDSRGRDTAAAVAENLKSGAVRVLAEDPQVDIDALLLDPQMMQPIAAASLFDRTRWQVLDPEYRQDFETLAEQFSGDLVFNGMSDDRRKIIVAHIHDKRPLEYHCYDRASRKTRKLFSAQSRLEGAPLASMESVVVLTKVDAWSCLIRHGATL